MTLDGNSPSTQRLLAHLSEDRISLVLRRERIQDGPWAEIAATVAGSLPRRDFPITLTFEQLLNRAGTLRAILRRIGAAFVPDSQVTTMLQTIRSDKLAMSNLIRNEPSISRAVPPTSIELSRPLRPFQQTNLDALWNMRHGANFSVPGAGKTIVTYALHIRERDVGRVDRLLVVAPLSAFGAWEEEAVAILRPPLSITRWNGYVSNPVDIVLINYQRLRSALPDLSLWMKQNNVHLIVDEAHRAKRGGLGEWGRALMSLAPLAARRDLLTGTPAPNHPRDLVSLLDILWPGGAASRSIPRSALVQDPTTLSMSQVNAAIRPLYVRTTKDNLALPPVTFASIPPIQMGRLQQDIYDAMRNRYAGLLELGRPDAAMFARMGEVTMYLIQAASSPQLLATSTDASRAYRYPPLAIPRDSQLGRMIDTYSDHEIPAKIAAACQIVFRNATSSPPRKTLLWSNFPGNLLALEKQLAGMQPALVYGGVPSAEEAEPGVRTRERELERFRDDENCLVLLANPAALAEGVSLHRMCHEAVYLDRTFNAGNYLQSLDRIHRLGLPEGTETRIHLLMSAGTIDERIDRRVGVKMRRLSQMLDDPALVPLALPDEDDLGPVLDDDLDLQEVLSHLSGVSIPHQ